MHHYLVFRSTGNPVQNYNCHFTPMTLAGHVTAVNEDEAAKAVAAITGRVGEYHVIESTRIDLAADSAMGYTVEDEVRRQGPR